MWFFNSPQIVFGEQALDYLENLEGLKLTIITDANILRLGMVDRVRDALVHTGMEVDVFSEVEPDPTLDIVRKGAEVLLASEPDWILALGGGSVIDAAKAMWVLYERPGYDPEAINPVEKLGLRQKARFIAVPTTSGTGSETTWAIVLTNNEEHRKLGLGSRENIPDLAIIDPELVLDLPPRITADTGLDVLTHAVEGYTSNYHNDFSDGLCLKALQLVFTYLPRAYKNSRDGEARMHMHNAASIAGLGFGNSMAALAHGMGHALGAVFNVPHGRAVSLFLPYTIEFSVRPRSSNTRYSELARFIGMPAASEEEGASALLVSIRNLYETVDQPQTLMAMGIERADFEQALDHLVDHASLDAQTIMAPRIPIETEMRRLFEYAYDGRIVDF